MRKIVEFCRSMAPAGVRSGAMAALIVAIAACGGDGTTPAEPAVPEHVIAALKDPRIGAGLPPDHRFAGVEHNRLSLVMLRSLRGESRGFRDVALRCAGIMRIATEQAPRTAAAAGVPSSAALLLAAAAAALAERPECATLARRPLASITADTGSGILTRTESYISDAAFERMDSFVAQLGNATTLEEITSTINRLAAAAAGFSGTDAEAILALVSQVQGSYVLWEPAGAGWTELGEPSQYESVLGRATRKGFFKSLVTALTADAGGCVVAVKGLRTEIGIKEGRLLAAGCALGAAAGTVVAAYDAAFGET
jgi:hypothetical protein